MTVHEAKLIQTFLAETYGFRKPRMEQMRLAIEKTRGYKKGSRATKGGSAKKGSAGTAKKKSAARRPKSVKARYANRG